MSEWREEMEFRDRETKYNQTHRYYCYKCGRQMEFSDDDLCPKCRKEKDGKPR